MLRAIVGVVVLDLVIVPGEEPRVGRVRGLEVGVALVQRVADPVFVEGLRLPRRVGPDVIRAPGGFVDVVADVDDQVEVVLDHVAIRDEVALLELLAGGEGEAEAVAVGARGRRGPRAADPAHLAARAEAVPVPACGLEMLDLDVHRVRPRGRRGGDAALDHLAHAIVGRHLPLDRDRLGRHAARRRGRRRGQAGPEDHAVRRRIAGGHAERERRPGELGLRAGAPDEGWSEVRAAQRKRAGQEPAAADTPGRRFCPGRPKRCHDERRIDVRRPENKKLVRRDDGASAMDAPSREVSCARRPSSWRGRHVGRLASWCRSSGSGRPARASRRTAGTWCGRPRRSSSCARA